MELFLVILYKLLSDVVREIGFSGRLTLPKLKFAFIIKVLLSAYFLSVCPPPPPLNSKMKNGVWQGSRN